MRDLTADEIAAVLRDQRVVRVGFAVGDDAYLVPVGYVWFEDALWVTTTAGRKTRLAEASSRVTLQVDDERDAGFFRWRSVTGVGTWEPVTDPDALARAFPHQVARFGDAPPWWVEEQTVKAMAGELLTFRIVPGELGGRTLEPPAA
ncbi:MAG: pyridoxamine 5'-phosphate oxidase family protein [Acidimicrobiia bacterium]